MSDLFDRVAAKVEQEARQQAHIDWHAATKEFVMATRVADRTDPLGALPVIEGEEAFVAQRVRQAMDRLVQKLAELAQEPKKPVSESELFDGILLKQRALSPTPRLPAVGFPRPSVFTNAVSSKPIRPNGT